jgi:hypothetical protein
MVWPMLAKWRQWHKVVQAARVGHHLRYAVRQGVASAGRVIVGGDVEQAGDRLLLQPFTRIPFGDSGPVGQLGRCCIRHLRQSAVQSQPIADVYVQSSPVTTGSSRDTSAPGDEEQHSGHDQADLDWCDDHIDRQLIQERYPDRAADVPSRAGDLVDCIDQVRSDHHVLSVQECFPCVASASDRDDQCTMKYPTQLGVSRDDLWDRDGG